MGEFIPFNKIARLSRDIIITEKIDGTNAQIYIDPDLDIRAGSRNRWLTLEQDNFGFAKWVHDNKDELIKLGPGRHFGEWWGQGIQRRYGLSERRFSLFNVAKWGDDTVRPSCCHVVPVLYQGLFTTSAVNETLMLLQRNGSTAAPGFMDPEGVVVFHTAANMMFKKTIVGDDKPKSQA